MEISKEQIAKMAESYKKAETQHVAQRAVTKNGILESAESVEVLKRMSPKNFAFSIEWTTRPWPTRRCRAAAGCSPA